MEPPESGPAMARDGMGPEGRTASIIGQVIGLLSSIAAAFRGSSAYSSSSGWFAEASPGGCGIFEELNKRIEGSGTQERPAGHRSWVSQGCLQT